MMRSFESVSLSHTHTHTHSLPTGDHAELRVGFSLTLTHTHTHTCCPQEMMRSFESVRAIRDTETPVGLRLFCFTLIHVAPVLLAPYWVHFCALQV